jgi:hypothetical protein
VSTELTAISRLVLARRANSLRRYANLCAGAPDDTLLPKNVVFFPLTLLVSA